MKRIVISLAALMLMITLGACGNKDDNDNNTNNAQTAGEEQPEMPEFSIDEDESVEGSKVVATINGEDISGDIYNVVYTQAKMQLRDFGQDVSDLDLVKELTLNALVDQELIRQDAEERGISVSEDEVETEYNEILDEDEEEFHNFLEEFRLEEDAFKDQLMFGLFHEKYVESEVEANVSDEELENTYNELKESNDEMPDLEEIEEELREQLLLQKSQEELQTIVEDLKEKATIETKI